MVGLLTLAVGSASAVPVTGPRIAIVSCCPKGVITVGPNGERVDKSLVESPYWRNAFPAHNRLSWSADGGLLAFGAVVLGVDEEVVAISREDGSGLRVFPRAVLTDARLVATTSSGDDPVISPDGTTVAFSRVLLGKTRSDPPFKSAIWLLDVTDGSVRRLTKWRFNAVVEPTSYSPDGSTLAAQYFDPRGLRAVTIDPRSGRLSLLVRDAIEPVYSPDGTRLAFVRPKSQLSPRRDDATSQPIVELFVARADGGGAKRLLRKRGLVAWPSWDPSGSRLTFTRSAVDSSNSLKPLEGDKVMAINADGTCLTKVFSDPELTLFGSAWQPGVGREAGPISC
jgi:dipeptidyl aminopeptidase/acylaminoacyl peptidase